MSKFLVETHYTCTFKIVHELDELNEKALSEVDSRKDGKVEIVNVTVNNRKTKRTDGKKQIKSDLENFEISHKKENLSTDKLKNKLLNDNEVKANKFKSNKNLSYNDLNFRKIDSRLSKTTHFDKGRRGLKNNQI